MGVQVETLTEEVQTRLIAEKALHCLRMIHEDTKSVSPALFTARNTCPPVWDELLCWGRVAAGEVLVQGCPNYVLGFNAEKNATKFCTENGTWYIREGNESWTNYSQCYSGEDVYIIGSNTSRSNVDYIEPYLYSLRTISNVGHAVSLISLLVALIIFASIKKLHCPRNKLHMHLFSSFVMKASMTLLKVLIFKEGIGLTDDLLIQKEGNYFNNRYKEHWLCKLIVTMWQYSILANFSWILMEGLYLHNLIFLPLFTDSSDISSHISLGWGLPAIFVLTWAILRVSQENTWCWTTTENKILNKVITVPLHTSVVVNFILFINIVRVLRTKIKSPICEQKKKYRLLAKSTLILVPLFGVHHAILLGLLLSTNETVEIVWLFSDQLFTSFNGFFVALLFCFLNGEVKTELSKKWDDLVKMLSEKSFFSTCLPGSRKIKNYCCIRKRAFWK